VKRSPRTPVTDEAATPASIAADDSLLASLGQYARGRGLGDAAPQPAPPAGRAPTPRPAPAPFGHASPAPAGPGAPPPLPGHGAPGLTRRVRGAQLPTTSPLPLRRPAERAPARSPGHVQPADDVYRFLTDFTAGVRRGLDHRHDGRPA
jgi:hypothetical protein